MLQIFTLTVVCFVLGFSYPSDAVAYIGPGTGITTIGAIVAFLGAILLAIVGFVWYPIKRLRNRIRATRQSKERTQAGKKAVKPS